MSDCTDSWAHGALDRLFVGELEAPHFEKLRAHVSGCQSCSRQYDRVTRADAKLNRSAGLSPERLELLKGAILDRVDQRREKQAASGERRWWMPGLGFAMAAAVAVGIAYVPKTDDSAFQARGSKTNSAFGIRAFCVSGSRVIAEALPGGKLKCPHGNALQLTYTAPAHSTLRVHVGDNTMLDKKPVSSGVDVPLDFSTPVTADWLSKPVYVTATFDSGDGQPVTSNITVEP